MAVGRCCDEDDSWHNEAETRLCLEGGASDVSVSANGFAVVALFCCVLLLFDLLCAEME